LGLLPVLARRRDITRRRNSGAVKRSEKESVRDPREGGALWGLSVNTISGSQTNRNTPIWNSAYFDCRQLKSRRWR
jgi:hypothetical protein